MKKLFVALVMVTAFIAVDTPAASTALLAIRQIPEPGSMLLFGIGLILLGKMAGQLKGN